MRSLKVFSLALAATLALSAMGAAQSSADEMTSESSPVVLTGSVDPGFTDQFLTTAGTVQCTTPKYTATTSTSTTSVTGTGSATGCTTAGVPSTVSGSGCSVKANIGGGASTTGDIDLVCSAGSEATVTVTPASGTHPCTIHVKAQSDITGTVTYTNIGAGATREITVNAALTGIDYTHTAGTGLAKCTAGSATNGTVNAKAVFTGEQDPSGSHVGIFLSNI